MNRKVSPKELQKYLLRQKSKSIVFRLVHVIIIAILCFILRVDLYDYYDRYKTNLVQSIILILIVGVLISSVFHSILALHQYQKMHTTCTYTLAVFAAILLIDEPDILSKILGFIYLFISLRAYVETKGKIDYWLENVDHMTDIEMEGEEENAGNKEV